jgi:HindIII restriction endonuclease
MRSTVIEERADSADVIAETVNYRLVGDAKAFRLSRTAKNQKDFKVEALNSWKKGADYACLVCPLYQYPTKTSQIYDQAIRYNVTLLSFTHLGFLLRAESLNQKEFDKIWSVSGSLGSGKEAAPYWKAISQQVALAGRRSIEEWDKYLLGSKKLLHEQAKLQLAFWESKKETIRRLNHDEAVEALISALRIDSNIAMITGTIADLEELITEID